MNTIKVVVTAHDAITSRAYTVVITRAASVPGDWSLLPSGLSPGDQFRLVFLSSMKRNGSSSNIAGYNTFIQNRAAAGHTDIQAYSSGFRVVGCTRAVDARDNTGTTYTNADKGVPIYWLNGAKVADDYQDFYNGSWDEERNDKNELGANGPDTTQVGNYPLTGCEHNGTESRVSGTSYALGRGSVTIGGPNNSGSGIGPLSSPFTTGASNTRPMYGLSEVIQVPFDDATLSGLELNDDGGSAVTLIPAFALGTRNYAASVAHNVVEVTIIPTVNERGATYEIQGGSGTGLVDADANEGDFQVALSVGVNTIIVVVTAQDVITSRAYTVVITRAALVPSTWSLVPAGLSHGDRFRLVFLSSTRRDGLSSGIAGYNTFIQNRAAAGHTDIQAYSSGFRVVGCTRAVDARDNTHTTYAGADKGVPIYWLNGAKVADDYQDFYDGSWDEERNDKNELGANGPDTSVVNNHPLTGCDHDGTEAYNVDMNIVVSQALGQPPVRIARPNSSISGHGPLSSNIVNVTGSNPMYGLSEIFEIISTDATLSGLELKDDGGSAITLTPAFAPGTTDYAGSVAPGVDEATIIPTVNDSLATYEVQDGSGTGLMDADPNEAGFQVALSASVNTIKVEVTAPDDATTRTYTVVITDVTPVSSTWSLIPADFSPGDRFRLVFLSSAKRDGSSSDIADYNTFVQDRAANGHLDIRAYSSDFRVVGCTEAVDARDNTGTTYISTYKGVPIYWLNGAKAADDYEDFYDGSWDEEASNKNELGANGPNISHAANYPITGCDHDGTESRISSISYALGSGSGVRVGVPNNSGSSNGPISSSIFASSSNTRPMYGLSEVFEVGTFTDGVTVNPTEVTVTEGGTATYTVVLDSEPTGNVTVTIQDPTGNTDVTADPATLMFTDQLNWDTAQTVTVTAGEDADTTNDTVTLTHSAASTDTDYDAIVIAGVTVTVEDNDTAQVMGVMVTPGNARLVLNWTAVDNATGYQVQWKSGVEDYNTSDRQATVTPGTTSSHTIGGLSNGTEYTVRVIATRTGANDGPPSEEVKGTPAEAGVTVSKTALAVTEEDTTGDTYTVVLTTQPAADVVVTVAGHCEHGCDPRPRPP